jgi:hypothetical protein
MGNISTNESDPEVLEAYFQKYPDVPKETILKQHLLSLGHWFSQRQDEPPVWLGGLAPRRDRTHEHGAKLQLDRARKSGASTMKCERRSLTPCDWRPQRSELRQGYYCQAERQSGFAAAAKLVPW